MSKVPSTVSGTVAPRSRGWRGPAVASSFHPGGITGQPPVVARLRAGRAATVGPARLRPGGSVGLFGRLGRRRDRQRPGLPRQAVSEDRKHLEEFVRTTTGVEAFVEPRTTVTETTVVLVATTGSGPAAGCPRRRSRTTGRTHWVSRRTTRRSSATRSGCGTGQPRRPPSRSAGPPAATPDGGSEASGRQVLGQLHQRPHREPGAALGRVPVGRALVVRRPGDVDVRPPSSGPTNSRRNTPPESIPPSRALSTLAMSATCESRPAPQLLGQRHRPHRLADAVRRRRGPRRGGRRRCP